MKLHSKEWHMPQWKNCSPNDQPWRKVKLFSFSGSLFEESQDLEKLLARSKSYKIKYHANYPLNQTNNRIQFTQKYVRIHVPGHYIFRKAKQFSESEVRKKSWLGKIYIFVARSKYAFLTRCQNVIYPGSGMFTLIWRYKQTRHPCQSKLDTWSPSATQIVLWYRI